MPYEYRTNGDRMSHLYHMNVARNTSLMSHMAERTVAKRKSDKITTWRVFSWRPFARPCKDTTNRSENTKGRHAKTRQMVTFSCFSHSDLSPRQAKIRQTEGEKATHENCRTFVWRGERSSCKNTNKSPFGGFSCCAFSPFRP